MNKIKDKNEKIFKKILSLMDKGKGMEHCLKKYPEYSSLIKEYFTLIDDFGNLKGIKTSYSRKQELFSKIIKEKKVPDTLPEKRSEFHDRDGIMPVRVRKNFLKPVLAFCFSFIFIMFAFTGTVFASEKTLPGDTLYPVKITAEKMQSFIYPEVKKGKLYYNFLNRRITEADSLIKSEISPDDENFIFLLNEIEKQYDNCKRYGYFNDDNDFKVMEQIRQIRRHGMKNQNKSSDNQETESGSLDNDADTYNSENSMNESNNFKNSNGQNTEANKKGARDNGKN